MMLSRQVFVSWGVSANKTLGVRIRIMRPFGNSDYDNAVNYFNIHIQAWLNLVDGILNARASGIACICAYYTASVVNADKDAPA